MAFGSGTTWDIRTTGDDTNNGGGFDLGNANFATDLAATVATGGSPVVTSASYTFVAGDVGAFVYVKIGSNWTPGLYPIASVSAGAATLSAAIGAAYLVSNGVVTTANTVAGCATTASPTGGTWGLDYSQGSTTQISFTDMVIGATTTQFTSVLKPVGKNLIGNVIPVTSGTGFTVQRVQVASTSTITATCDKSLGTTGSTGGSGKVGWPLATPGLWGGLAVGGNDAFLNAGTYTLSNSANVAGGKVSPAAGTSAKATRMMGWSTHRVRDNTDTRPVLQPGAGSVTCVNAANDFIQYYNLDFVVNGQASCTAVHIGTTQCAYAIHCRASGFDKNFVCDFGPANFIDCESINATTTGIALSGSGGLVLGCSIHTGAGLTVTSDSVILDCVVANTTTGNAVTTGGSRVYINGLVIYGTAGANTNGLQISSDSTCIVNTVVTHMNGSGTQVCYSTGGSSAFARLLINCASDASGAGNTSVNITPNNFINFIPLTVDPYTNAGSLDFTLNNTAGGGALLRAAGYPAALGGLTGSNYRDVGAFQHADSPAPVHVINTIINRYLDEEA